MRHYTLSVAVTVLVSSLVLAACSSSNRSAASPSQPAKPTSSATNSEGKPVNDTAEESADSEQEARSIEFPSTCAKGSDGDLCLPPEQFVKALCASTRTDAALALFAKGSPWTRRYLRGKVLAWDATGQASDKVQLQAGEEVIVLRHRGAAPGGMVVSGASDGYDVVRWDGTCVSLDGGEISKRPFGKPYQPLLDWRHIDDEARERMLADKSVMKAYKEQHNECKGVTMGEVSKKCVVAHKHLSQAIVRYVQGGGKLPQPALEPADQ